jgi:hypothetical protein
MNKQLAKSRPFHSAEKSIPSTGPIQLAKQMYEMGKREIKAHLIQQHQTSPRSAKSKALVPFATTDQLSAPTLKPHSPEASKPRYQPTAQRPQIAVMTKQENTIYCLISNIRSKLSRKFKNMLKPYG